MWVKFTRSAKWHIVNDKNKPACGIGYLRMEKWDEMRMADRLPKRGRGRPTNICNFCIMIINAGKVPSVEEVWL